MRARFHSYAIFIIHKASALRSSWSQAYHNQRTNNPVNAHLISMPSTAQNIQNLENVWQKMTLTFNTHNLHILNECLHLTTFRSLPVIDSNKILFSLFLIEKPKLPNLTLP